MYKKLKSVLELLDIFKNRVNCASNIFVVIEKPVSRPAISCTVPGKCLELFQLTLCIVDQWGVRYRQR